MMLFNGGAPSESTGGGERAVPESSGLGGTESETMAVLGRKREAMSTRWLRYELEEEEEECQGR
jgi:hypothetical protein